MEVDVRDLRRETRGVLGETNVRFDPVDDTFPDLLGGIRDFRAEMNRHFDRLTRLLVCLTVTVWGLVIAVAGLWLKA